MKIKYLLLALAGLLVAAGVWAGRLAWRVHHQLVTLDVRNTPLQSVLHQLERQTWTRIRAEAALNDARITLHVTDKPLAKVLDRIAAQAGARWSSLYAVYDTGRALHALDAVLQADGKIESAGWKKLAPDLLPVPPGPGLEQLQLPPQGAPASGAPPHGQRRMMIAVRGKNGPTTFFGGAGGVQTEVWSPEELVAENSLSTKLETDDKPDATPAAAAALAHKLHGHWATLLAFRKSSLGLGFTMPHEPAGVGQPPHGPNPNERFANLTPQQRVQLMRQRTERIADVPTQPHP